MNPKQFCNLMNTFTNFARPLHYRDGGMDRILSTMKLRSMFTSTKVKIRYQKPTKCFPGCGNFAMANVKRNNIEQKYSSNDRFRVDPMHRRGIGIMNTANAERMCWNCNREIGTEKFFCNTCRIIQPPLEEMSFFEILDSNVTFDIDLKSLTNNYRKLQSLLHPDKFGNSRDEEQQYSAVQSALINKAYNTLLDPLTRALYMLQLRNITIGEKNTVQDPEFLMEVMELNEMLSDVTKLDDLDKIREKNNASIDECISQISESLHKDDLENAKEAVIKLRYYRNILDTIQKKTLELE